MGYVPCSLGSRRKQNQINCDRMIIYWYDSDVFFLKRYDIKLCPELFRNNV